MKSNFLKMAGCKTEKEFYKKYPTEADFKKAFPKAQFGAMAIPMDDMEAVTPITKKTGTNKFLNALGPATEIIGGLNSLEAEKNARRSAEQLKLLSDIQLQAASTIPEAPERSYARPEDYITNANELFPTYGVGTNVLAKYGTNIKKAQDGTFLSMDDSQWNQTGYGGIHLANMITGQNAGGQIGSGVGGAIGSFFGPAGKAIGSTAGTLIGGIVDTNPKKIKKAQEATMKNVNAMAMLNAGYTTRNNFGSYLEHGGDIPTDINSGTLQTHWGGEAETISYNEFLPGDGETIMFKGQSHSEADAKGNTGIGITYGNTPVEVENNEPALKLIDENGKENLTVFGDLKIPKGVDKIINDPSAKNKKFKNYITQLSNQEEKLNNSIISSADLLETLNPNNKSDKLKIQTIQAKTLGSRMKLKDIADRKQILANIQDAINSTSEEHGLNASKLAYGKIVKAQSGGTIKGRDSKWDYTTLGATDNDLWDKHYQNQWVPMVDDAFSDSKRAEKLLDFIENTYSGPDANKIKTALQTKGTREAKLKYLWEGAKDGKPGPMHNIIKAGIDATAYQPSQSRPEVMNREEIQPIESSYNIVPSTGNRFINIANNLIPFLRPSDVEDFNPAQIVPEMYALSTNQLEPVQAQSYQPLLDTPYDISYQDILNENQADYRSSMRLAGYNPAAIAALNAAKYQANAKVLGEQFRANQAKKDQVYSTNRSILNDAALKNLQIYDQQYDRQEQAKANTKATTLEALKSITDKQMKHNLDMRTLGIYENLYNYRYDAAGRAINMNPLFNPNLPNVYNPGQNPNYKYVTDTNGKIIGYQLDEKSTDSTPTVSGMPSLATPPINNSTTYIPPNYDLKEFDKYDETPTQGTNFIPYNPEEKLLEPTSKLDKVTQDNYLKKLFQ